MPDLHGKFIVFDGGEGCGKSTQANLLRERLATEGYSPIFVRDPGSTRIGEKVRSILLDPDNTDMSMRTEMLLYMAARAQMMAETILPALAEGKIVLCDRFVSSTLAYQLGGDGLGADEIKRVAEIAIKGRWPDVTLILDMPLARSSQRVQAKFVLPFPTPFDATHAKDRIEQRPMEYHEQVRRNYLKQAKDDPKRYRVIDADREPAAVHEDIWKAVSSL